MQDLERQLQAGHHLTLAQVKEAAAFLLDPEPEAARKAAFLKSLAQKGETPDEIAAFVSEFLVHAIAPPVDLTTLGGPVLDVVGTGGDKLGLFNVSTTAVFILAAGGVVVAKHGNRGITSRSGGADVLESLGVKIDLEPDELVRCLRETGIGFVFAPKYHPAFKAVVEARKLVAAEGHRTIFNLMGPLLNPLRPPHQLIGVFDESLVPVFADILRQLGRKRAWVVHGRTDDNRGMDELSTLGANRVAALTDNVIERVDFDAAAFGFARPKFDELTGGEANTNADILEGILANRIMGAKRDLAVLNAAAGFVITGISEDLATGKALAEEILNSGRAHVKLRTLSDWC